MRRKPKVVLSGEQVDWTGEVADALEAAGFDVELKLTWDEVVQPRRGNNVDAIVLLFEGRSMEFISACRSMAGPLPVSVLFIGASSDSSWVVESLDAGADDALIWPPEPDMLRARLRAVIRRAERSKSWQNPVKVRDLTLDMMNHEVMMGDRRVDLTPTEFRILACLLRNAGRVVPSHVVLKEAHGYDCEEQEAQDIVKVHIRRLRNKLEPNPNAPTYIVNIRGFGYMLERRSPDRRSAAANMS